MHNQLIECVPNFSEGRDLSMIKQITDQIETVEAVSLLDVDPGNATNRTVVTFVGPPEDVLEAAVRALSKASQLIDMRKHKGAHPRFGATDVCPLVPVANITMEETVELARRLAKRLGEELGTPIFCYEDAAFTEPRKNLATVRAGEYEGLREKLAKPDWKPDFGPREFNPKSGATAVGARDFLVAYNVNLNTTSTRRANAIAFDVREKGRVKTETGKPWGKPVLDERGEKVWTPGSLKAVKAIGWFIEEYGVAQISINLTNLGITPVHLAFDEVCKRADARGVRVTGSELVGLIPLQAMLDAGRYFLRKQQRSTGISDLELIQIAVKSLGLDDLYPFKPDEKIIEYAIADKSAKRLADMPLGDFVHMTASEAPAPGGGSISAAMGAMGAALATMVANLSSHKRGWDDRWAEFSEWAEKGKACHDALMKLIDADTDAFNRIMTAFGRPKRTEEERTSRNRAIQEATRHAIEVPFQIMQKTFESLEIMKAMAEIGNPNSVSDAGVGALAARSAILGAFLNVKINSASLTDKAFVDRVLSKGQEIEEQAIVRETEILDIVNRKIKL